MRRTLLMALLALTLCLTGCAAGSGSLVDLSTPWGDLDLWDRRDDRMPAAKPAPACEPEPEAAAPR